MPRLGLALSGGGFRATLYHLGVVRFLKDADQLQHVTDISSVSGGSVLSAHLVLNWDRYNGDDKSFDEAASEIVKFVQFDVRNRIIRRLPFQYPLRYLAKFTPLDQSKLTPNRILEHYYRTLLYGDRRLYELPDQPALHILTTDIINGGLSVFNKQGLFIKQRGDADIEHVAGTMASLPRVVGASSAFPGLFPPVKITASDIGVREGQFTTEWFTDGGVYDNLGIRAFSWLKRLDQHFDQVLVSDAGKPFQILSDASLGFVGQSMRASDILWDRVWQLERENFGHQDGFTFLPITEQVELSEDPTALHPVVQVQVQSIRTDLDSFSDLEVNALAQHGYEVARKICHRIGIGDRQSTQPSPWAPIRKSNALAQSMSETRSHEPSAPVQQALRLRKSSRRRTWSTLLSLRDWTSYVYMALALLLFVGLPLEYYRVHRRSRLHESVLATIRSSVPEVGEILDLIDTDPTSDWTADTIGERPEPSQIDYTGIEIVAHSRIIDLRKWRPTATSPDQKGHIYVRDRRTLKLDESYSGNRRVTFQSTLPLEDVEWRQTNSLLQGTISRVTDPLAESRESGTVYEIEYNLEKVLLGEPVTVEIEARATFAGLLHARMPFVTPLKTDLLFVWMFFPEARPYETFNLVRYPADRSSPPEMMDVRHKVDDSSGLLMGWSVVNPKVGAVYECRWTERE